MFQVYDSIVILGTWGNCWGPHSKSGRTGEAPFMSPKGHGSCEKALMEAIRETQDTIPYGLLSLINTDGRSDLRAEGRLWQRSQKKLGGCCRRPHKEAAAPYEFASGWTAANMILPATQMKVCPKSWDLAQDQLASEPYGRNRIIAFLHHARFQAP